MDMDLQSYVKVYNNWIDNKNCDLSVEELELDLTSWKQHTYYNPTGDKITALNADKEFDYSYDIISSTPYIMKRIGDVVIKYIEDCKISWMPHLTAYTEVRFNKYTKDTLMSEHADHIHSIFDGTRKGIPTLSCLALLNDDFTGGEFIMFGDKQYELKKGDMMIFPSNFLYPHRVEPVTSGIRYSCVSWVW